MNSFYRVVFCKSTGVFKAVSELAKSGKKTKSISIAAGVLASSVVMSSAAIAAVGDPVASGEAIGLNALAVGETNTVDGNRSTAIGSKNGVSGESNTALGVNNKIRPTEDYSYDGDGDGMETLLTPSIRSTAIGVENTIEGNESVANGVFNKAKANNVTITGGRNEVSSKESGTYGQGNYVGKDMVVPALGRVRVDDGYRIGYRGYINEGSYAYGNSNQVLGDKSHAVGNSNNVSGDKNGLLGNGNSLSTEKYEQPRRMATARMAVGDGELSRAIVPVSDGGLPRNRWDGRDEGSFLVGNENEVNGINTHAVGNQNQIRNDDNVTLGSGNRVEYQDDYIRVPVEATRMRVPVEATRIRDDSDRRILRRNTSTAIVGANNTLEAAGVHIVGTDNNIRQAYSYVVGGGNTIESSFSSPMIIAGAPESGSNVFGSGNDIESEKSSVVGDSNRIDQKSLLAVVTGSENNISGVSSSTVGNNNQIRKDVGGAHGTMNKVQGNAGALQAINAAYDAYNSGEAESFEGLDLDKDGVVDFATVEEFMLMVNKSGSYAYGNINNIQGEGIHTVGNNNEFSGNNNKGVGNNNRIGQVGGMVGNSDAVLPTAKFYDSATYGDFNVVNADSAQTIGNENVLGKEFSSVTGYNNSVVQGLSGELVDVTTEQRRIAGTFVSGNDNSVESHGGVVSGSGNEFQADRATLSGSENIVIGDEGHVVGNDNEVYGKGNNGFGNNNVIGKVMNGDHSSVDSSHIVGNNNTVEGNLSSAFGNKNTVSGDETSVIGLSNTTDGEGSLILGNYNENQSSLTTMVGGYNNIDDNYSDNAVAVGQNNSLSGNQAAAFGNKNSIEKDASGAIGVENYIADGFDRKGLAGEGLNGMGDNINYNEYIERGSYAQGNKNDVRGDTTHVYGYQNGVLGNKASVMGANNSVSGNGTQVIGNDNTIGYNNDGMPQYGDNIAVLGSNNAIESENSFVVGSNNTVDRGADGSLIFGSNASSSVQNGVAIGNGSTVDRENTVSFGSAGEERQLTNVADATENTDAVNLGQLNASLRDTTGDENITATKTDTGYNVALNKNVALDSVTTGTTSMGTNGVRAGDVFLSSTSGLDNAGNRITSVGDAIENTDAVNFGQFKAGLTDTTAGKNVAVRRTDTGYEVSVLDDITLNSMTAGTTVVNTNGFQAGAVTITNTGLDNASNRVTSVGDAIERSDAVNYGQFTDGLAGTIKSVTGDENVVAVTDANKNVTLALQKDVVVDSVTTGATSFNTDGVRAGDVFLSSATGLDNAGNRVTNVGDAIENTDAVNFGQFKAGLTDTTAGKNVNVTRTDTGYEVALNDNVNVNSLTAGTTVVNTDGFKAGSVTVANTGLDNAGNRVTSVGDAIIRSDAVNYGQFTDGLAGTIKSVTGDENIIASTDAEKNVILNLQKDVVIDSMTTGATLVSTDGVRAGDVFLSSTSGLDNAGNRITSVGDAVENTDAVNFGQFKAGLTDTTAGKNVNVTRTDTGYEVALNDNVNVNSLTAGTTVVNTDGLKAGSVTVSSTGVDNAGNRVTSVGDAIEQTDAVNLKQLNASLRDTTGDENITATKTDTGYNVALNKNVALDSVTTGTTSMGTDGVRAGDVFLSSTTGLDNAGNRVTSVGDAIIRSDAVNYGQFTDGLAGTIKSVTGDENVVATTDAEKNVTLVLQKDVVVDSVTTGATSFNTDGVRAGDVVLSSTTGLSNAGNRVTQVGDAIERSDAVNYGQFQDGLNGVSKTTVDGDKNIISTKNATGYDLALNKDLEAETLTTGNTVINNNGLTNGTTVVDAAGFKAGSVTVSSTGVDNAGNRVTSVGDAIDQTDAVNLKQLNASVRDTSAGKNIAVKRTDTGFEVALDNDITLGSVTTGNTLVNTDGVKVGDVTVKSTGVDNAGNRVTSVGDAIIRSDAVNYGQFTDGLAGTIKSVTGDENVIAVTDANKNVTLNLNKNLVADSLTTGNTLVNNSGMKVGDVTVRSTGLDNANNRVTSVADAIERSDAVNYGQFQDGLNGLTKTTVAGDKNITSTKTDTGYGLTLNDNLIAESVTTGDTIVNTDGVKVGDVTVKSTGVDNAGNRVTSVGDAIENTDAVNLKQLNASLRDTTGDENITATKTDTGYNVALNRNLALDSIVAGNSSFNTDGFRAGEVFLSSTSGLSNAGYRITKVGNAIAQDDAVNLGQVSEVDDRLTQVNNQQNSAIIANTSNIAGNTAAINQGFNVGNGSTSNKFELGSTVNITADANTVVSTTPTGVQVGLAKDIAVDSVTTGSTSISNAGVTVGGVNITDTSGLNNAGFTVSGVGNAVNRDEAINKGQFDDAIRDLDINGVTTKVTGDSNIIATTVGTNVSLELAKDIKVDSVTTGNSSMSNDGFKTGDVTITANSGLNNAGFTVSGVGDAVKQDDAVNLKQLGAVEDRLDRENAAQNVIINNKTDKSYVDAADQNLQAQVDKKVDRSEFTADQARQDAVIQTERDVRDAADKDLQAQVDKKVEKEIFEADQKRQDAALKSESDVRDAADKDLQAQVDKKVEKEIFEADQKRQDAALKAESDVRDASDKDLQAQVDKKVEKEVFEADQARQDAAIKDMASMDFVNQQVSSSTIINNDKFEAMANKQKETDAAQDVRITNNQTLINDLGYKVDGLEDKLSAGVASAIAFASMPSASKNGEVRLSGGSGYFNGAGALAVGLTGASETGEYTYKLGGSYTKDGGAVVGAGISYRIW